MTPKERASFLHTIISLWSLFVLLIQILAIGESEFLGIVEGRKVNFGLNTSQCNCINGMYHFGTAPLYCHDVTLPIIINSDFMILYIRLV